MFICLAGPSVNVTHEAQGKLGSNNQCCRAGAFYLFFWEPKCSLKQMGFTRIRISPSKKNRIQIRILPNLYLKKLAFYIFVQYKSR